MIKHPLHNKNKYSYVEHKAALMNYKLEDFDEFDWEKYLSIYDDLKDIPKNKNNAIVHWILHGKKENRLFFKLNNNITDSFICDIKNNSTNVLMICNATTSHHCGGTKTCLNFLYSFQKMGISCDVLIISGDKNSQPLIIEAFNALKNENQVFNLYFNVQYVIKNKYVAVVSTYNYTCYYASLINAEKYLYFIQDFEPSFFNDDEIFNKYLAINSYSISNQFNIVLGYSYIQKHLSDIGVNKIYPIQIGANSDIYTNLKYNNKQCILFTYYENKSRRNPELIKNIASELVTKFPTFTYLCFPDDIKINGVKHMGFLTPPELNLLYNRCIIGFCFSETNISRLSYEMAMTGMIVFEKNNCNNLNESIFVLIDDKNDAITKFNEIVTNESLYNSKVFMLNKIICDYSLVNEELQYTNTINQILSSNVENKKSIYFFGSNGNLGCDVMKSYMLRDQLSDKFNIVCVPTDINFSFNYNIFDFIENIKNSVIFMVRSIVAFSDHQVIYNIKKNGNFLIYDHVDIFIEDKVLKKVSTYQSLFDLFLCNNDACLTYMNKYIHRERLLTVYHMWDSRYLNSKILYDNTATPKLGFIGCVKCIDLMLSIHKDIVQKYNIQLLDCECWEYVNEKYNEYIRTNNKNVMDWTTRQIDFNLVDIKFNVHVSLRDPNSVEVYFKTNAKISTAACLDQIIITTKEPSNIELLNDEYPFYLNDITVEEFDRVYNLMINDFNGNKILWKKGLDMLRNIKYKTDIKILKNTYLDIFNSFVNKDYSPKKYFFIGLNKTASKTTQKLINDTGLKCNHSNYWTNNIHDFDCFCDEEYDHQYEKYKIDFPNAVFILNTRALGCWIKSCIKHLVYIVNLQDTNEIIKLVIDRINFRIFLHQKILDYFLTDPQKLHILNVSKKNWESYLYTNVLKINNVPNQYSEHIIETTPLTNELYDKILKIVNVNVNSTLTGNDELDSKYAKIYKSN